MQDTMWRDADPEPFDHEAYQRDLRATFGNPSRCGVGERNIKVLLGVDPEAKWPREGVAARIINGWRVWVDPLLPTHTGRGRRCAHRARAHCLLCQQEMSAGRVHQHVCYGANRPRRRKAPRVRCHDCGAVGERTGHMGCMYPENHE